MKKSVHSCYTLIMQFLIFVFLFMISFGANAISSVNPFSTDFCTAYPEGTRQQPTLWKHCCIEHDLYFWAGGSLEDRKASDLRLKSCVEATGATTQASLIYMAVSVGGNSPIRFKTKEWGNAWEKRERYLSLTENEVSTIVDMLDVTDPNVSEELKQSFKEQLHSRLDAQ